MTTKTEQSIAHGSLRERLLDIIIPDECPDRYQPAEIFNALCDVSAQLIHEFCPPDDDYATTLTMWDSKLRAFLRQINGDRTVVVF